MTILKEQALNLKKVLSTWPDHLTCNVYCRERYNPFNEENEFRYDVLGWLAVNAGASPVELRKLQRASISSRCFLDKRELKKGIAITS